MWLEPGSQGTTRFTVDWEPCVLWHNQRMELRLLLAFAAAAAAIPFETYLKSTLAGFDSPCCSWYDASSQSAVPANRMPAGV